MSAERIARTLGGGKVGAGWTACCLVHDDQRPSSSIRDAEDGTALLCCHAGCGQERLSATPGEHKVVVSKNRGTRQP